MSPDRSGDQPEPYYLAARFRGERHAGRAYFRSQEAVFNAGCDLSVFRLILSDIWHVAVLGVQPPEPLERRLRRILAVGEPGTLPPEILVQLQERREQAMSEGDWVERHFRPGQPL